MKKVILLPLLLTLTIACTKTYYLDKLGEGVKKGDIEKINYALEHGVDINSQDLRDECETALMLASSAYGGNVEIVKYLISKGADINLQTDNDGWTPLMNAAHYGEIEIVKLLLSMGVDIYIENEDKETALIIAAANNQVEIVKLLLAFDKKAHKNNKYKQALLNNAYFEASLNGNYEVVQYLISSGAEVNCRNSDGSTVLISMQILNTHC